MSYSNYYPSNSDMYAASNSIYPSSYYNVQPYCATSSPIVTSPYYAYTTNDSYSSGYSSSSSFNVSPLVNNYQYQNCIERQPKRKREPEPINEPVNKRLNVEYEESEDDEYDQNSVQQSDEFNKKRVLTRRQRVEANQRERKRMKILNEAIDELRAVLPISSGRKRKKMSRQDVVVGAIEYIQYLDLLLQREGAPGPIDFEAYLNSFDIC